MKRVLHLDHAGPVVRFDTMSGVLHVGDLNPQIDINFVMTPRELIALAGRAFLAGLLSLRFLRWNTL
jgi:hypothetical protein